ncbi:MAG: hypothetical protein ABS34_06730 [Opitutaceae bacterium BACL24 MAG-120322-bin51]|jgi:uncharacterized protein|nr:MAG: hypothetical protein ABS34_06730 [Opitutaceae bacterium BACL24 MAG-120322-bin51]
MNERKKTVLVSGATGMLGKALCVALEAKGHSVRRLSRGAAADVKWDVAAGTIDAGAMTGVDVVVHLAGEPVAQRWTGATKAQILESRVGGAELLVGALLKEPIPPDYITASGINYYGHQCGVGVTERSPLGGGFLAHVCDQWEGAAQPLIDAGIRSVSARIGMILSSQGGALTKMLPAFKLGLGGVIGAGSQHMSWVSLPDAVRILLLAVEDTSIQGPLNVVSPEPLTNRVFTQTLGAALKRPTFLPMPAFAVKALFGKMGIEVLCADVGVLPQVLLERGFEWNFSDIKSCFEACLAKQF